MANYQLLKADIDAKVYQNGHQEITGENLNAVLNAMVTTLGAEYQFAGVATKDTNPETTDAKVFYIANGKGTYTNFGGINVTEDDVVVLYWDSSWHKVSTGIASQAKLTELEEKTNTLEVKTLNSTPFDVPIVIGIDNKFIYVSGYSETDSRYAISQPIHFEQGDKVTINAPSVDSKLVVLAGKTPSEPYLPIVRQNSSGIYEHTIAFGGDYVLSFKKTESNSISVIRDGQSLESKIEQLQNSESELRSNVTLKKEDTIALNCGEPKKYIYYSNAYPSKESNKEYNLSELIPLRKGDIINISNWITGDNNVVSVLSRFDGTKYYACIQGKSNISNYTYEVVEDGNYLLSWNWVLCAPKIKVTRFESSIYEHLSLSASVGQSGKFIYGNGYVDSNSSYAISNPIHLNQGDIIKVSDLYTSDSIVRVLSRVTERTRYDSLVSANTSEHDYEFHINSDGDYVLTYEPSLGTPKLEIDRLVASNVEERSISNNTEMYRCLDRCICIGDSNTSGVVDDNPYLADDNKPNTAYPAILGKITGWNVNNAGVGGITAQNWFKQKFGNYDFTQFQIAIIELCYNQDYTDTLATDVEPYTDYHDFADTQTGNLCKIIAGAKAQNPNIFIVMVVSPSVVDMYGANSGRYAVYKKIAEKYDIPVIDLTEGKYINLKDSRYHGWNSTGSYSYLHFNAIGYTAKANVLSKYLDIIFKQRAKEVNKAMY